MLRLLPVFLLLALTVPVQSQGKGNPVFDDFEKTRPITSDAAPRMHLKDTDGKEMDLREYLGSWVVIEFGSYT